MRNLSSQQKSHNQFKINQIYGFKFGRDEMIYEHTELKFKDMIKISKGIRENKSWLNGDHSIRLSDRKLMKV